MEKLSHLLESNAFPAFGKLALQADRPTYVSGLEGSSPSALVADLYRRSKRNFLYLAKDVKAAETMVDDLSAWLGDEEVLHFPGLSLRPYEWRKPFGHVHEQRLSCFEWLYRGKRSLLVATWDTFLLRLTSPESLHLEILQLKQGERLNLRDFREAVTHMGFTEEPVVQDIGEFSIRGEILDIYPYLSENPLRIVLFGDEIESIKEFDIFTQRSVREVEVVELFPLDECCFSHKDLEEGLLENMERFPSDDAFEAESHKLLVKRDFAGIHWQKSFFKPLDYTLLDFLGPEPSVILEDWDSAESRTMQFWERVQEAHEEALAKDRIVSRPEELFLDHAAARNKLAGLPILQFGKLEFAGKGGFSFQVDAQIRGGGGLGQVEDVFSELYQQGISVYLLSPNEGQAERLKKLVKEMPVEDVLVGSLVCGFVDKSDAVAVFTDHQIFNRFSRRQRQSKVKGGGVSIQNIEALGRGDFVVHEDYGVGRYVGIKRVKAGDHHVDCILLEYKGKDKLSLPVTDFKKLEKFSSKEGHEPSLNKLGGKSWEQLKEKTKKSIVRLARELIELYAKRSLTPGFPFSPDNELQKEFEQAFEYEPTPDQRLASEAVKEDLRRPRPTDRLVCGDVGFGKTEVAMRAAFKAVQDKKQVCVLAPTTILASQHYHSFSDRFSNWPVNIDFLNRFKSAREQKETVAAVSEGKVDILIGTHRALSKDVQFKDIGLLIIDEEQKFGVKHKERLKEMRTHVDVISMSATPIPRTLHMSMVGARDLSIITTPPRNRLPISTKVVYNDPKIIREAIEFELGRGGQIYFVHNRVEDLPEMTRRVEELVPQARVGMAHGQMNEVDLEQIMAAFVNREYDVLVCTAIIESGLDISNVNTIIIHRAELFGLSQLYQLRGRVGRSATQAFCYLISPDENKFSDEAKKRLYSLQRFTDLGSGFQIAMRDLEIRGAGNILGTEQSGHIAAVGFETYCRLLKEAMEELRGGQPIQVINPEIEFPENAYIPEDYVEDSGQRIALYQKISRLETVEQVAEMQEELQDRFGKVPQAASNLLAVMMARVVAQRIGFQVVELKKNRLRLQFSNLVDTTPESLKDLVPRFKRPMKFVYGEPLQMVVDLNGKDPAETMAQATAVLRSLV